MLLSGHSQNHLTRVANLMAEAHSSRPCGKVPLDQLSQRLDDFSLCIRHTQGAAELDR